jgi:arabinan endo-1,5-alpha-L-arabinosidase
MWLGHKSGRTLTLEISNTKKKGVLELTNGRCVLPNHPMQMKKICLRSKTNQALWKTFGVLCLLAVAAGCNHPSLSSQRTNADTLAYTNPVYAGSMPDPSVIRHGKFYYAFGTTGADRLGNGRIFTVLRSENLVNWQQLGGALMPPSTDQRVQYWAPEATFSDGMFYLYYAMGGTEPERFELRTAMSPVPEGPYVDNDQPLIDCESNRFAIDPFPFKDDDGKWYMFYARNFTNTTGGAFPGTAMVVDRLINMTELAGDCRVVVRARYEWTRYQANRRMDIYNATFDWHTIEGPSAVKHDGKYYCFYSGSNYQTTNYGVDYVVADHPLGPYRDQSDHPRVLHSVPGHIRGPGHHSIVKGPDGKTDYLVYHAWDPAMEKRWMCIDKLIWTKEGPRCEGPTWTAQNAR